MNLYSLPQIIVAVYLLLSGYFVYKNGKTSAHASFAVMCLGVFIWLFSYFILSNIGAGNYKLILFLARFSYLGVTLIPMMYYQFVAHLLNLKNKIIYYIYIVGIFFILLSLTTSLIVDGVYNYFWGYYPKAGIFHPVYLLYTISSFVICLIFLYRYQKRQDIPPLERTKVRYVFWAFLLGNIGSVDFIQNYGFEFYPVGSINIGIFMTIIGYAIIKHRLMDIKVAITRAGLFLFFYIPMLSIPFFIGYKTQSWVWSTVSAVVLATVAPIAYSILQRKAEDVILAQQRRYQKVLMQAASGMIRQHNLEKLSKLMVYIVKRTVGIEYSAIFLHNDEYKVYELKEIRDHNSISRTISFEEDTLAMIYLQKKKSPILPEEMPSNVKNVFEKRMGTKIGLIVPSVFEKELLGFLVLGEKNDKSAYSQDDINVFKILSSQAALAIENCIFFTEFKKAQSRIFEAEKLASIGGMADGVAHQIKNRLNHFSVASGELKLEMEEFLEKHPEFAKDETYKKTFDYVLEIAESMQTNVKRTDAIVKGILNYARTSEKDTFFDYFSLDEIIDLSIELIGLKHEVANVPLGRKLNNVDQMWGVKAQITEVVYNLLDNGFEAIQMLKDILPDDEKSNYEPLLTVELYEKSTSYVIKVSDNGIGVKPEDTKKIFAPFFTTKSSYKSAQSISKSGSGIGMYVVKRLVEENHQGSIMFESEYLKGTTFLIELPKKKSAKKISSSE